MGNGDGVERCTSRIGVASQSMGHGTDWVAVMGSAQIGSPAWMEEDGGLS